MPDAPDTIPRQRFTQDLRRIREAREVTIAEVHDATQISISQIEAFEAGSLYDQSTMNPVYLRAFVRAYAEAVGLPPDAAVRHLEAALGGSYEHQMATKHLDVPPPVVKDPSSVSAEEEERREERAGDGPEMEASASTEPSDAPPEPEGPPTSGTGEESPEGAESQGGEQMSRPSWLEEDPGWEGDSEEAEEPLVDPSLSGDAASTRKLASPRGSPSTGRTARRSSSTRSKRGWGVWVSRHRELLLIGLSMLILVGILGTLGVSYFGGTQSSEESEIRSPSSSSNESVDSLASLNRRPRVNLTLGDTFHVTVLATSNVQRMRVRQDDDLRRPYWIEEGEATVFPFTRRITLENQLDEARLFLEQYPYPTTRTDSLGRIVIDRQTVEAFADTLRGSPATFSDAPDTVALRVPPSEEGSR